jgi:hypothetical protein
MRTGVPRVLLALGWGFALASLATAFAGWQRISSWAAETRPSGGLVNVPFQAPAAAAAPWLLIGALALTAASLLAAF